MSSFAMASKLVVAITGANTGIGFETVKALVNSEKQYHVLLGSRSLDKAEAAISSLDLSASNSKITPFKIDVTDDTSIDQAFQTISGLEDHIDVLINNAGGQFDPEITAGRLTMRSAWNKSYDLNVTGSQITTHTMMPLLLKSASPRLLFITSGKSSLTEAVPGYDDNPNFKPPPAGWPKTEKFNAASYRASKAAMNMMMLEWARSLQLDGVKIWCVAPGFLATGLGGHPQEALRKMGAGEPESGGGFIRDVVEGKWDGDTNCVVRARGDVQPW